VIDQRYKMTADADTSISNGNIYIEGVDNMDEDPIPKIDKTTRVRLEC